MQDEDAVLNVRVDDDLMQTLTCGICRDLMENPTWIRECGHTFCRGCVESFLAASNSPQCPKCRLRFDKKTLVACYHLVEILGKIVRRCGRCDAEYFGARESHARECLAAQICQDCGKRYFDSETHRPSCPQLVKCCGLYFPKSHESLPHGSNTELEAHRSEDSSCPLRWKRCPNCDLWVRTSDFHKHEWSECAWTCGLCRGALFRSEGEAREKVLELHRAICPEERIRCDRCPEGLKFRRRAMPRHDRFFHSDGLATQSINLYHVEERDDEDGVSEGTPAAETKTDEIQGWETVVLLFGIFVGKCTDQFLEIDLALDKTDWKNGTDSVAEPGRRIVTGFLPEEMSWAPQERRSPIASVGSAFSKLFASLSLQSSPSEAQLKPPEIRACFRAGVDGRYRLTGSVVEGPMEMLCLDRVEFSFPGALTLRPSPLTRLHLKIDPENRWAFSKQFFLAIRDVHDAFSGFE